MKVNDVVEKTTGDYTFVGKVVAVFTKCDGVSVRVVVENAERVLHIFSPKQLQIVQAADPGEPSA